MPHAVTVLVISNANAARARRGIAPLRETLPESAGVLHQITTSAGQITGLVGHDRWHSDDLLVINGGDGTVQHVLTMLLARCPPGRLPRIACLPGGTTNMTAYDLNGHRGFAACLRTVRRAVSPGEHVPPAPRSVVRVAPRHAPPTEARCGLFFGIGAIVRGIEYFHAHVRRRGSHELGAGVALARALWGIARGQADFSQSLQVRLGSPFPSWPDAAGGEPARVGVRLLLATTLDRLFLGLRPYWGSGPGPLKATLVESRAGTFLIKVPRLLRGRPDSAMTPDLGYHSARLKALTLAFTGAYTLDGELFTADDTIDVTGTEAVNFLPL